MQVFRFTATNKVGRVRHLPIRAENLHEAVKILKVNTCGEELGLESVSEYRRMKKSSYAKHYALRAK